MNNWSVIFITILIALAFTLLPMPNWTIWLRPAWVLLVLIYWSMTTPYRVSVGFAWLIGLVVDVLNGSLLGEHALAFTIVIYFVSRLHIRLTMSPMLQQGITICVFILIYQFILYCIQGFIGKLPGSQLYWLSSFTSMLLWPWLFVLLRDCRRWFRVA